jgi:hypothetical protein
VPFSLPNILLSLSFWFGGRTNATSDSNTTDSSTNTKPGTSALLKLGNVREVVLGVQFECQVSAERQLSAAHLGATQLTLLEILATSLGALGNTETLETVSATRYRSLFGDDASNSTEDEADAEAERSISAEPISSTESSGGGGFTSSIFVVMSFRSFVGDLWLDSALAG